MPESLEKSRISLQTSELARFLVVKLNKEIENGHTVWPFVFALALAVTADFLDVIVEFLVVTFFPMAPFIYTFGKIIKIFLFVFLYLFSSGKGWFKISRIKLIFWILGFFVDNLPLFENLPIQTLNVLYAWHIVRRRAKKAGEVVSSIGKMTEEEIKKLHGDGELSFLGV